MRSSVLLLLVPPPETPLTAPTIISVARTSATQATVRVSTGWARLLVYYPDTAGSVVFDSNDVEDAATIINGDGYDELVITLPGEAGTRTDVPLEMVDADGVLTSDPTPFEVPPLRRGGGMMGGGALVGFGGL
jgi:hypothetical protein